jgi:hypothetical protein
MVERVGMECNQALLGQPLITQAAVQVLIKKTWDRPYPEGWAVAVIRQHFQRQEPEAQIWAAVVAQDVILPPELPGPMEVQGL